MSAALEHSIVGHFRQLLIQWETAGVMADQLLAHARAKNDRDLLDLAEIFKQLARRGARDSRWYANAAHAELNKRAG